MKFGSGTSQPAWIGPQFPETKALTESQETDVCVIGAGMAGLTTALLLARDGLRVTVLEAGELGGAETSRTTAHLSYAIDDRLFVIEKTFGLEGAKLAVASHKAAIDLIEHICREEQIDCAFERVNGYLLAPNAAERDTLDKELAAAHRLGCDDVAFQNEVPLSPQVAAQGCLVFPHSGQLNPTQYMAGIAHCLVKLGVKLYTKTRVTDVTGGDLPLTKTEAGFTVSARRVVVAANVPFNDRYLVHTKQAPYRSYVAGFAVEQGAVPRGLFWDTLDPYHYIRTQSLSEGERVRLGLNADQELLIVGGEDHKTGQADDASSRFLRLEAWTRANIPAAGDLVCRWSGQVMETDDGLAFIGKNPGGDENVFIATGDSGMGITHGAIAGMLLSDLVMRRDNPWAAVYAPSRAMIQAASFKEFLKENLNVGLKYGEWLLPPSGGEIALSPGEGTIVQRGAKKVAIYCDEEGKQHELPAACPHLGGLLHWNHFEKSWDCPLHGSRFDGMGNVLCGPAMCPLKAKPEQTAKRSHAHRTGPDSKLRA